MGNSNSHDQDVLMRSLANKRELDISKKLPHSSYVKHTHGEAIEGCLTDLPWDLVDEVSLYERVNCSFNLITTLPVELPLRLPHLQYLNLNHNRIEELPESIALFFHLEELHISYNLLSSLPRNIINMRRLFVLDVSHNQFKRLPDDIGDIPGLQKLNASHNQLSLLPTSLGTSRTLSVLLVDGNKFLSTIYEAGSDNVLAQLRDAAPPPPAVSPLATAVFSRQNAPARGQFAQLQAQKVETGARTRTPLLPPTGASRLEPERLRDCLVGLLFGAALGDALGLATDGLSRDQCRFYYSADYTLADTVRDERRVRYRDGDWTANTDLMLVALDSLLHWGGVLDELDLAQRLHGWRDRGLPDLADARRPAADLHVVRAIDTAGFTEAPHAAARQAGGAGSVNNNLSPARPPPDRPDTAADDGCLPMAIICGIPRFHDLSEVAGNAQRVCLTTHAAPVCVAACVALAAVVAQLLQGGAQTAAELDQLLRTAAALGTQYLADEAEKTALAECMLGTGARSQEPTDGGVVSTLSVAVAALRQGCSSDGGRPAGWRPLVTSVTLRGGRTCVAGTLSGALLGARCGLAGLPAPLLSQLRPRHAEYVSNKLNSLLDLMGL